MRQLWLFLAKYHVLLLFFLLEAIGFGLLFSRSNYQRAKFLKSTSFMQSGIAERRQGVSGYFQLKEKNEQLALENKLLQEKLELLRSKNPTIDSLVLDSTAVTNFDFFAAKVMSNQMSGGYNHLTIDKGKKDSVSIGDAVMTAAGAVGKVVKTNKKYALVMPIFNLNSRMNVQHKASSYNGDLVWTGANFEQVQVEKISRNANVEVGDTIVANQYSKFPEGTPVGIVAQVDYDLERNFYHLNITPTADFRKLNYVYVVQRRDRKEMESFENSVNE